MEPRTAIAKLGVLLPHWLEHNRNHEAEFRKWAASARAEGAESLATLLDQAAANMAATEEILRKARSKAGPADGSHDSPPALPHSHVHGSEAASCRRQRP